MQCAETCIEVRLGIAGSQNMVDCVAECNFCHFFQPTLLFFTHTGVSCWQNKVVGSGHDCKTDLWYMSKKH